MPLECFAVIKASADGDSEAQREEQQSQVSAKEGAHYQEPLPRGGTEGPCGWGEAVLWQRRSAELRHFPGANPFMSAGRGAVCVITGERGIRVIFFLSLASSVYEIAKRSVFFGGGVFAGKIKGVKVGTSRDGLFFHTFSESSVTLMH